MSYGSGGSNFFFWGEGEPRGTDSLSTLKNTDFSPAQPPLPPLRDNITATVTLLQICRNGDEADVTVFIY